MATGSTAGLPVQTTKLTTDVDMIGLAENLHHAMSVYVGTILVVFGLIGNTLSIVVWRREKMTSSTGTYLIGQAVADAGVLILFFVTDSIAMMAPEINTSYSYGVFFSYIGYPIFYLFVVCSIWFTVGVTVDRYIHVCWIMHTKTMCSIRRARITLVGIALLCFIINVPHFWTFKSVRGDDRESSDAAFQLTEYGQSEGGEDYEFWVHCMFLVLAPWVTIFTLNMLIMRTVNQSNSRMNSTRSTTGKELAKRTETHLTRLLLIVTFTFLLLIALQCITQCFFMLKQGDKRVVSEAYAIAKLGVIINSSINFLLYCVSARRFRRELKTVVCGKFTEGRKGSSSFQLSSSRSGSSSTNKALSNST